MRLLSFISYFFAGIFCTNTVPHLVIAITGRRNITPFGRNSSPLVNLLWSVMNFASGYVLFRFADKQENIDKVNSNVWQAPYTLGCFALSVFAVSYAWLTESKNLKMNA